MGGGRDGISMGGTASIIRAFLQAHVNAIDAQIARDESLVAADQRIEADAMAALRRLAIKAAVLLSPLVGASGPEKCKNPSVETCTLV